MDFEKHIETYINKEKAITPSSFLFSRIKADLTTEKKTKRISLRQAFAAAASIAIVIASGVLMGSSYNKSSEQIDYTVVNDSQIENFIMLTDDGDE